jgi:hypothetical protein
VTTPRTWPSGVAIGSRNGAAAPDHSQPRGCSTAHACLDTVHMPTQIRAHQRLRTRNTMPLFSHFSGGNARTGKQMARQPPWCTAVGATFDADYAAASAQ